MEYSVHPDDPKRFRCSVKKFNPMVSNQKRHPNCLAHVMADMSSYIHRMNGVWINSSPQPFIDKGDKRFMKAESFMTNRFEGLQSNTDYQHLGIKRDLEYQLGNHHYLDDVNIKKNEDCKQAILDNFGEGGPKYPIPAGIKGKYLHELRKKHGLAKEAFHGKPYKVSVDESITGSGHAILLTGVDVMDDDEELHSVEFKNSWGRNWGEGGFTKVTFDFFKEAKIFVPVLDMENRRRIHRFCINTLVGHKYAIKDMCFSADGHLLATASDDGVRIFHLRDASSKHFDCVHLIMPHGSCPSALCFDDDLSIVVATESKTNASLYMFGEDNLDKRKCCIKWHKDTLPNDRKIAKISRAKLNGSTVLVTCSQGTCFRIWHGQHYEKEFRGPQKVKDNIMAISPNGQYIATAAPENIVRVWELSDGNSSPTKGISSDQVEKDVTVKQAFKLKGHTEDITSICFAPDSQTIITASQDGSLKVWAINYSGLQTEEDLLHTKCRDLPCRDLPHDSTDIKYYDRTSISPDGKILAVARGSLLRWIFVESGEILETIGRAHKDNITSMTWAHIRVGDKQVIALATVGDDKDVKLWAAPSETTKVFTSISK